MKIRLTYLALLMGLIATGWVQAQLMSGEELVKIETALSVDTVHPGSNFQVAVIGEVKEGWHVNANPPTLEYLIPTELKLDPVDGLTFGKMQYPEASRLKFAFADEELDVYEGRVIIRFPVSIGGDDVPGEKVIKGTFRYQACNDQVCLAPVNQEVWIPFRVASLEQQSRPINLDLFESVASDLSLGGTLGLAETNLGLLIEEQGWFLTLLALFVLGLALNLTPCVYPMIPVTISYFSRHSEGRTSRLFGLALMYLLGIAVTYSVMGVVAALTGQIFGALLQNPWVLVGIAGIMVALALSLFGLYQIQAPNFIRQKVSGDSGRGVLGALSMGLVVGIVAAPCVGPVTIGLLTYVGATGNPWVGFWMFFTLSMGLGIPYVALGTFSGGLKKLPRSGVWMLWVEKLFGFAMLGLALYFIAPLFPEGVIPWIVLALALVSGVWLGWLDKDSGGGGTTFHWLKKATGLAALAVGVVAVIPETPGVAIAWQDYDPALFDQAREEGRPVLLDFTANWCIPCRELERFTFSDEKVIAAVNPFLTLKVDLTHFESPEARPLREQFDVVGVPTIVFLDVRGREVQESRVVGYLGPDDFLQQVKKVQDR